MEINLLLISLLKYSFHKHLCLTAVVSLTVSQELDALNKV